MNDESMNEEVGCEEVYETSATEIAAHLYDLDNRHEEMAFGMGKIEREDFRDAFENLVDMA